MKTLKSVNFYTQLVTLLLSAFAIGGLQIDPTQLSGDIVAAVVEENFYTLLVILVINLLNPIYQWIKTLKNNPGQFWLFVHSTNWWVSVFNVFIVGMLLWGGIEIPIEAGEDIIAAIFDEKWMELIPLVVVNILIPILKSIFKKKPLESA